MEETNLPDELKEKSLTPRQEAFLEFLFSEEAEGDVRKAMTLAGYSASTKMSDITSALHDQIQELTRQFVSATGPEAAFAIRSILRNPTTPGANTKMNAAEKVLDRAGAGKGEQIKQEGQIQNIFILPPKGWKAEPAVIETDYEVIDVEDE